MSAAEHRPTDPRDPDRAAPDPGGDDERPVDRAVTTVKHGIDQVADKVKGLLRSDR